MATNKQGLVMGILILVIVILLAVIAYAFWLSPTINGYIVEKQIEAKDIILSTIIQQVQQQGYTQITDKSGNALILVLAQPKGQQAAAQPQQ